MFCVSVWELLFLFVYCCLFLFGLWFCGLLSSARWRFGLGLSCCRGFSDLVFDLSFGWLFFVGFAGDAWMVVRLLIVFLIVLVFRCFGLGWYLLLWLLGDMVCFVLI